MKKTITLLGILFYFGFSTVGFGQINYLTNAKYGQVFDVTFDPNHQDVIYARTVTNHIMKSKDKGKNWEMVYAYPIGDSFALIKELRFTNDQKYLSFIVSAEGTSLNEVVIFDPENKTVVKSYLTPIGTLENNLIVSYSITGENYENVLLHTTHILNYGLISNALYSRDGGATWDNAYESTYFDGIHINDVAIHPNDASKLYIARGESPNNKIGGMLISTDEGWTWEEKIPDNTYTSITFNPENPDNIYVGTFYGSGENENLYRTFDGGNNWEIVPIDWTTLSTNSIHDIKFNPLNTNDILVLEENEIAISHDAGQTWENKVYEMANFEENYYYGIWASYNPFQDKEVIISANYYPFISQDGGKNLIKLETPFANNTDCLSFHNQENKHLYYGLRNGSVHLDFQTGEENEIGFRALDYLGNVRNSVIYADPIIENRTFMTSSGMMGNSSFLVSQDYGQNFVSALSTFGLNIFDIDTNISNSNQVWVSFGETLYYFDFSDMDNIQAIEKTLPNFGLIQGISSDRTNENSVFITINNHVYFSDDKGNNWTEKNSGLESLEDNIDLINDIIQDPKNANRLLISTSQGLFETLNYGESWTHIFNQKNIDHVFYSPYNQSVLVGTSHYMLDEFYPKSDTRIVYSIDSGKNWKEISTEELGYLFTESSAVDFLADEKTVDVYFSTSDLGLVKYTFSLDNLEIQNLSSKEEINVYPNPTSDFITFDKKVKEVKIYDSSTKLILQSNQEKIDLSHLPKGIYIVRVWLENDKMISKKIIKK